MGEVDELVLMGPRGWGSNLYRNVSTHFFYGQNEGATERQQRPCDKPDIPLNIPSSGEWRRRCLDGSGTKSPGGG